MTLGGEKHDLFTDRIETLRNRLAEAGFDVALITDDDSVYCFTGCFDYLHMDFGRPTILVVPQDGNGVIVTEDGYEQITQHPNALEDVVL